MTTNDKNGLKRNNGEATIKRGSAKPLFILLLIVAVILFTVFMLLKNNTGTVINLRDFAAGVADRRIGSSTGEAGEGDSALVAPVNTIFYDSGEETEFCLYRNYIVECSKDTFSMYGKNGEEVFRKNIEFQKPLLKKSGNYLLAADAGGRTAFVMEDKNLRWEEHFNSNMTNISINANGYIAVVLETVGYRSTVRVMAPIGRKLFDWVVADDYVISTEISPSNDSIVLNRINTNGIGVRSVLEFLDIKSEPFAKIVSDEGDVFLKTLLLDDDTLATASEVEFVYYSEARKDPEEREVLVKKREVLAEESFDAILAMSEFPKRKITLAVERDGRSFLITYQRDGKSNILLESELPIINMTAENSLLIVNLGKRVLVMKENGKIALDLSFESEVLYGSVSGKSEILIVTKRSADLFAI